MPRTKKVQQRQSSLVPGSCIDPAGLRYLEVLESQLEASLQSSLAEMQAVVQQVCRKAEMWYNDILRTVPMEVLMQPVTDADIEYREPYIPDMASLAQSVASTSSGFLSTASTSTDGKSSTLKQSRQRVGVTASTKSKRVAVKKKASPPGSCNAKPAKVARKVAGKKKKKASPPGSCSATPAKVVRKASTASSAYHTPLARTRIAQKSLPVVTPKFDIRKRPPATARTARQGEVLLSLSGSPVASRPPPALLPVHVHLEGGKVVKLKAESGSEDSVKQLCQAIQQCCGRKN